MFASMWHAIRLSEAAMYGESRESRKLPALGAPPPSRVTGSEQSQAPRWSALRLRAAYGNMWKLT